MAASLITRYDVAIVGAGFAGLSAAARLSAAGARVVVFEAKSRLGGRATAFTDRETGERVDNGQHVLLGCYTETLKFLQSIDALEGVRIARQLRVSMIDRDGRPSTLECPMLPAPLHLLAGALEWTALKWRDRMALLRMGRPSPPDPDETVDGWLRRNAQTDRLLEMLWEPLALAALNQPPSQAAAQPFARVLQEMFRTPEASAIVLPTRPLDEMYAEPARAFIEHHGGAVWTGTSAIAGIEHDRVRRVDAGLDQFEAASTILAVPWHALGAAVAGDTRALEPVLSAAAGMHASPIVTVNLWFDHAILDVPFLGLPGRAMQWVFEKGAVSGERAAHLSLVSSGASSIVNRDNSVLVEMAHQELLDAMPAAHEATLIRASVVREPRATFSLAPGQPRRPSTTTAVAGLLLAGDWIDTGLPATIESAVVSGHRAADAARRT